MNPKALAAEFIGTFMLVMSICGTALYSAPSAGLIAVSLAAGISVLAMAYAVGHISGGHFNPAVTLGLVAGGRFDTANVVGYIIAQILGGLAAALVLKLILAGAPVGQGAPRLNTFAAISNTYGGPRGFSMVSAFVIELVITGLFVIIIMGATSRRAPAGFAPIAIGLALAMFHLISIPVTNASLNPVRSLSPALLAGGEPVGQLWLFWVAPILGGIIGGVLGRWLNDD